MILRVDFADRKVFHRPDSVIFHENGRVDAFWYEGGPGDFSGPYRELREQPEDYRQVILLDGEAVLYQREGAGT